MRTAIYIRVSSDKQVQEGDSIPAQRDALMRYISDHAGMIFVGEYLDDGVSGTKESRTALQRMLADVRAGRIDLVLVTKLDRLHRGLKNFLLMQEEFDKFSVNWLAIWEPIYDSSTPQGRLIINQMMSIAQFEAENTGSRIRQVQEYKVKQGEVISGTTPPGYRIEGKRLVPNEDAPNVVRAFEYYALTGNLHRTTLLCQTLHGLPNYRTSVKSMLRNRKYIGEHRGNPDFCPPIVDRDLFEDVQRKMTINIRCSAKRDYIFSGLVVCGECGRRMGAKYRIYHRQKGDVYVNLYFCVKHLQTRMCDNPKHLRENLLERYLLDNLKKELSDYVLTCRRKAGPMKDNSKSIAALHRKIDRLKDLYINELITLDEYRADKERMQAEIESLTPVTVDVEKYDRILELDLETTYQTFTPEQKRYFWRAIIREIRFDKQRNIQIFFT